jgi:hypothetical protein
VPVIVSVTWNRWGGDLGPVEHRVEEVLDKAPDENARAALLETAEYWLQLGLALGVTNPKDARHLLSEESVPFDWDPAADAAKFLSW